MSKKKSTDTEGQHTCCICFGEFYGWGNNPDPIWHDEEDRCCDVCNSAIVIPARIAILMRRQITIDLPRLS